MVVNVATHSHNADMNFEALVDLYKRFEPFGFEILAFPTNQFGKKELLNDHEIKDYLLDKYGVQFPLFHKIKVNGAESDEVFRFLRSKTPLFVDKSKTPQLHEGSDVGLKIKDIPGNFCKFLLD